MKQVQENGMNPSGHRSGCLEGRCAVRALDGINRRSQHLQVRHRTLAGAADRCRLLQLVDRVHKQENNKSQDQKLNDVLNKTAIGKLNAFNIFNPRFS